MSWIVVMTATLQKPYRFCDSGDFGERLVLLFRLLLAAIDPEGELAAAQASSAMPS